MASQNLKWFTSHKNEKLRTVGLVGISYFHSLGKQITIAAHFFTHLFENSDWEVNCFNSPDYICRHKYHQPCLLHWLSHILCDKDYGLENIFSVCVHSPKTEDKFGFAIYRHLQAFKIFHICLRSTEIFRKSREKKSFSERMFKVWLYLHCTTGKMRHYLIEICIKIPFPGLSEENNLPNGSKFNILHFSSPSARSAISTFDKMKNIKQGRIIYYFIDGSFLRKLLARRISIYTSCEIYFGYIKPTA